MLGCVLPAAPHADALGSRHWLIKYFRCYVVAGLLRGLRRGAAPSS